MSHISDLNSFSDGYVLIYDEIKTKLNIEWRKIDSNDYCNQYAIDVHEYTIYLKNV
jgi:hypothetical protein